MLKLLTFFRFFFAFWAAATALWFQTKGKFFLYLLLLYLVLLLLHPRPGTFDHGYRLGTLDRGQGPLIRAKESGLGLGTLDWG